MTTTNLTKSQKRALMQTYYVTYDRLIGGEEQIMVRGYNPENALANAKNCCATGSNFRNPVITTDKYIKPSDQGFQGRGKMN